MVLGFNRPFAHPISSFNVPVPLIESDPDEGDMISVCFNRDYLPYILGALSQLELQSTWKTDDPEAVRIMQEKISVLEGMFASEACATEMVETPFYDNEEDVDDEEYLGEQTWYDSLSDWVISGFLAISFTPAAAIAYNATIPRIRLALKTGDAGTIVRVIFGAVDTLYDTFSPTPEIVYLELDYGETFAEGRIASETLYPLRIEHTGTHNDDATPTADGYYAQIVKGDLRPLVPALIDVRQREDEPCILEKRVDGGSYEQFAQLDLCPPMLQIIDGVINTTPDGGETWTPVETVPYDPMYTNPPPPRERTEAPTAKQCSAALSTAIGYMQLAKRLAPALEDVFNVPFAAAGLWAGVLTNELNFFIGGDFFNDLSSNLSFQLNATSYLSALYLSSLGSGMSWMEYFLSQTGADEAPTTTEALKCIFACSMDEDGLISYSAFIDALEAGEGVPEGFVSFVETLGGGTLNAIIGAPFASVEAAECEDCVCPGDWCYYFDFAASNGGFSQDPNQVPGCGTWVSGLGWQSSWNGSVRGVYIHRVFDSSNVTHVEMGWTLSEPGTSAYAASGNTFGTYTTLVSVSATAGALEWDGDITMIELGAAVGNAIGSNEGTATITYVMMRGVGDNPFGENNCP